jgi:ribosome-associated heat shock protein Hsp15
MRQGQVERTVRVKGISAVRGPAPVAQLLYEETAESLAQRQKQAEMNRLSREPALSIEQGRPTKRDRRQMEKTWDDRWSAGID